MWGGWHPETDLVPFLRNDLPESARHRVSQHLDACRRCRATLTAYQALLEGLREGTPAPPALDWGRYQADLRARRAARTAMPTRRSSAWVRRVGGPVTVAAGVAAAAALLLIVHGDKSRPLPEAPVVPIADLVVASRLDLLRQYPMVERLELLQDLDVIRHLDELTRAPRG
jgi:anti-sigma factor RsiW